MSDHRAQQQDEIDLLQNIIFEKMKIIEEEPNYIILIEIKSDIENPKMKFNLKVTLNDEYPDKAAQNGHAFGGALIALLHSKSSKTN